MKEYLEGLIGKYRTRGVLVDSNLLILYFVGEFAPARIPNLRRTKGFTFCDYRLLKAIVDRFTVKVTTPNILTEITNLADDIPAGLRAEFFLRLGTSFTLFEEQYLPSATAAATASFPRFGLADSVIVEVAKQRYLVITAEFALANYLGSINADVINFNRLRSLS